MTKVFGQSLWVPVNARGTVIIALLFLGFGSAALGFLTWQRFARVPLLVVDQPDRVLPPPDGSKKPVKLVFSIQNAGSAPLEIKRVTSSCGCAVVSAPKKLLLPQEKSQIEVLTSPPPDGRVVAVTIHSNSANGPISKLQITNGQPLARIGRQVVLTSDWVYWPDLFEVGATQPFWIVTEVDRDAAPAAKVEKPDVECSLPFLHVSTGNHKVERPTVDIRTRPTPHRRGCS